MSPIFKKKSGVVASRSESVAAPIPTVPVSEDNSFVLDLMEAAGSVFAVRLRGPVARSVSAISEVLVCDFAPAGLPMVWEATTRPQFGDACHLNLIKLEALDGSDSLVVFWADQGTETALLVQISITRPDRKIAKASGGAFHGAMHNHIIDIERLAKTKKCETPTLVREHPIGRLAATLPVLSHG